MKTIDILDIYAAEHEEAKKNGPHGTENYPKNCKRSDFPAWLSRRIRNKHGSGCPYTEAHAFQLDLGKLEPNNRWWDHTYSELLPGGVKAWVMEPYCSIYNDFTVLREYVESLGCNLLVSTGSRWYDPCTIKLMIVPRAVDGKVVV